MKKFLLSASVLGVFGLYALHLKTDNREVAGPIATNPALPVQTPSPTSSASAVATSSPSPAGSGNPGNGQGMMGAGMGGGMMGQYKNGTYTGSVADAFYGNVQVQVTISGGKITDVQFLQYPSDRSTSVYINSQAMPLLKQEAIQAQSANVAGVSGASATSAAFIQSLTDALSQAH